MHTVEVDNVNTTNIDSDDYTYPSDFNSDSPVPMPVRHSHTPSNQDSDSDSDCQSESSDDNDSRIPVANRNKEQKKEAKKKEKEENVAKFTENVRTPEAILKGIGKVRSNLKFTNTEETYTGYATGTLIHPRIVLTCAHFLYTFSKQPVMRVEFKPNQQLKGLDIEFTVDEIAGKLVVKSIGDDCPFKSKGLQVGDCVIKIQVPGVSYSVKQSARSCFDAIQRHPWNYKTTKKETWTLTVVRFGVSDNYKQ